MVGLPDAGIAVRLSFIVVAIWWLAFSLPVLRRVPEPPARAVAASAVRRSPIVEAFAQIGQTFHELRRFKHALLLLLAFAIYNDGINTIIRMGASFATTELHLTDDQVLPAYLLVQFLAVPFAFLFGSLAGWIGAKRAVFLSLGVYVFICVFAFFIQNVTQFYIMAALIATVQGGSQALSRSLFSNMIPRHKSSEFFAFFGIFEKFTGVLGPLVFAEVVRLTGTSRLAILAVIAFFVVGGAILTLVDVQEGERAARAAELSPQS
jgi:UMF1 family MFS transporter